MLAQSLFKVRLRYTVCTAASLIHEGATLYCIYIKLYRLGDIVTNRRVLYPPSFLDNWVGKPTQPISKQLEIVVQYIN